VRDSSGKPEVHWDVPGRTCSGWPDPLGHAQKIKWAFQYRYDEFRRLSQKKVPGAGWVYMVYDNRDRLVMTQDANQRANNQWMFTKFDDLNRPVMTAEL
jgi:hypothetical protein